MKYNKKLLEELFQKFSPTYEEKSLTDFLCSYLDENKINYTKDKFGNIYKMDCIGKPILSAHQDSVNYGINIEEDKELIIFNEIKNINNKEYFIGRGNLGADDKCGIFIILTYLVEVSKDINFIFSVGEELTDRNGIQTVIDAIRDNEVFKSAPYCLVLDRHEANNLIVSQSNYGTKEFENQLLEIGKDFGFKPAKGYFCDANTLRLFMNCANISVGYYNAHSSNEFFCIDEMMNTYEFIKEILFKISNKLPGVEFEKNRYEKVTKSREKARQCKNKLFKNIYYKKRMKIDAEYIF